MQPRSFRSASDYAVSARLSLDSDLFSSQPPRTGFTRDSNTLVFELLQGPKRLPESRAFGLPPDFSLHDICSSSEVRKAVCKELREVGRQNGLQGIELIDSVVIAEDQWTPQNGLVTDAQKVNRRAVAAQFKAEIEEVYEHSRG